MTGRFALVLAFAAGMTGCTDGEAASRGQTTPPQEAPAPAPAAPSPGSPALDADWISGAWIMEDGFCASSEAVQLRAGGEFVYSIEDTGTWRFDGATLTITMNGESHQNHVERLGANEMRMGGNRFRRCLPEGGEEPWHPGENYSTR